ncbi:MAG TPA: serine hydrolase domain-containing protein [Nocardioides sp.]|nr:serine hydrolase domain-containing protein [Nocardioides sp.]
MVAGSGTDRPSVPAAARVDRFLAQLVTEGRLAGWSWAMLSDRRVVHRADGGVQDLLDRRAVDAETTFRIYSMTKPIVAVAVLLLRDRGLLALEDPIQAYLPEFAATEVYVDGDGESVRTRPPRSPITLAHALTHTAGLTYGFHRAHPVDALYRAAGHDVEAPRGLALPDACRLWASLPLLFEPGTSWNYSVGYDVLGRVIEVVVGTSLGEFLDREIFGPLGMTDTGFRVPEERREFLATLYDAGSAPLRAISDVGMNVFEPGAGHFGGGGLVSTTDDYLRFMEMLLGYGAIPGGQLLHPDSVRLLVRNHLPGDRDIASFGRTMASELGFDGVGQAYGGTTQVRPSTTSARRVGDFGWGGIAGSYFWIDPRAGAGAIFMLQAFPAGQLPIRARLHQLVNDALDDRHA